MKYRVRIGNREWDVEISGGVARAGGLEARLGPGVLPGEERVEAGDLRISVVPFPGEPLEALLLGGRLLRVEVTSEADFLRKRLRSEAEAGGPKTVTSAIPGVIRRVLRSSGDEVAAGDPILTLEAMKMENELRAETRGRVLEVFVREGEAVAAGQPLYAFEPLS